MKIIAAFFCLTVFACSLLAQTSDQILASSNGRNFTVGDLPPAIAESYAKLSAKVAETRRALLEQQVAETLFELEAKTKATTREKLVAEATAKVPDPTDQQIRAIYDANREAIGGKPLGEVRSQIVAFLRRDPEQKALVDYLAVLKAKYKAVPGVDVNSVNLKPTDVLATVGAKTITAQEFETQNKIELYETRAQVYDDVKYAVNQMIYSAVLAAEAKSLNLATNDLISREITDKLRDYTNDERERLETDLRRRLYAKYKTQILLKEPVAPVLSIATAESPSKGAAAAPVTVVMFSDFQCSHCAATHPLLQKVLGEYGDRVRFVVRNFPLTSIHENALPAALAAQAAHAQGKFFEYTEILYRNQDALDRTSLKKYAADLGLNMNQFELDWQSEKSARIVRRDLADGKTYGITGTPTVFVNGVKARVLSTEGFREAIERALKK
jgi:protein-disulfide isomerase